MLLNALAEDRGPDLFSLPNTWLGKFQAKLLPSPAALSSYERTVESGPQKRELIVVKQTPGPTPLSLSRDFVDAVSQDAVRNGSVIGLPLSLDTLVLYANTDLLAYAGIPKPATSWEELLEHTKKLRVLGKEGGVERAAVALGTANNVPRAADIVLILMLQNGVKLADHLGNVTLAETPQGGDSQNPPASEALRFYTDFSRPTKETYTWNEQLPNAIELFRQGRLAYLLGYSYHARDLLLAPKVHWSVAPLPHPKALLERGVRVALANTWLEVVSKKTKHPNEAWHFLQFLASPQQAVEYLAASRKPTALRSLVEQQKNDALLSPFSDQTLVAQSWYRGANSTEMERSLERAITSVVSGELDPPQATVRAAQQIQQTMTTEY